MATAWIKEVMDDQIKCEYNSGGGEEKRMPKMMIRLVGGNK